MARYIQRLDLKRNGLVLTLFIMLPILGVVFSRFIFEFVQGKWWYDTSTERTVLKSLGSIVGLVLLFGLLPLKRVSLSLFDFAFIAYLLSWFLSIMQGFLNGPANVYFIKQCFALATIVVSYLYGKSWKGDGELSLNLVFAVIIIDLLITMLGVYPNVTFTPFHFLFTIVFLNRKKYVFAAITGAAFLIAFADINRTLMLWVLLVAVLNYSFLSKYLLRIVVLVLVLVIGSSLFSSGESELQDSKTMVRFEQILKTVGIIESDEFLENSVSTNDRKYENLAVQEKIEKGNWFNFLFGFGAGAKYDVRLSQKILIGNANVHMGPWYELLNRGWIGVLFFSIMLLLSLIIFFQYKCYKMMGDAYEVRWVLANSFLLTIVYWFTWSNYLYTTLTFWFFLGYLSSLVVKRR